MTDYNFDVVVLGARLSPRIERAIDVVAPFHVDPDDSVGDFRDPCQIPRSQAHTVVEAQVGEFDRQFHVESGRSNRISEGAIGIHDTRGFRFGGDVLAEAGHQSRNPGGL